MTKFRRFVGTYKAFTKAGFQNAMAYRTSFLCYVAGEFLYCFVMYFIWRAVFGASDGNNFMGFSLTDITVYVFLSNLVRFLVDTDSTYSLGEEIKDGSIVMRMIKPVNLYHSLLFFELGNKLVQALFMFIPIMLGVEIFRYTELGYVAFSLKTFLPFVISVILSYLLSFYLNLIFGYLAFFLMNIWGFSILKNSIINFFSGALIPLAFFPGIVRNIFEWLPFASLIYAPTMIYLGKFTDVALLFTICKQIFWLVAFVGISRMIWHCAQKRLAVQGG